MIILRIIVLEKSFSKNIKYIIRNILLICNLILILTILINFYNTYNVSILVYTINNYNFQHKASYLLTHYHLGTIYYPFSM